MVPTDSLPVGFKAGSVADQTLMSLIKTEEIKSILKHGDIQFLQDNMLSFNIKFGNRR